MITLQQVQELRNRVDSIRIAIIELREENSSLKDEVRIGCERIEELEVQLRARQEADESIHVEVSNLIEDLDKELEQLQPNEKETEVPQQDQQFVTIE